jgi:hypothetical protein
MNRRVLAIFGVISLCGLLLGCATPQQAEQCLGLGPSAVERDYGTSYHLAIFNQTLNPAAEKNLDPVEGFDGPAAKSALESYRTGFEKPSPPPAYTLSIGGMSSK